MTVQYGMSFASGSDLDDESRRRLMGGKGAGLARMVALGLPVPPGFTLTTEACRLCLDDGWVPVLEEALGSCLDELQNSTGKRLGDMDRPLLVSIRSGAPVSMPGMMDTVLNAGMTDAIAQSLCSATGDARFGWDTLRRFLQSYVSIVLGASDEEIRHASQTLLGSDEGASLSPDELADATIGLRQALADLGYPIPEDPLEQVREAVIAVFSSWTCDRAKTYRRLEGIADDLYTAANVQMMAFGNLGERSGTGVAFSRNPSDGSPSIVGDFLQSAQGEDVVAGTHQTLPISALKNLWPETYAELERTATLLERDLRDLADIEFTVEEGSFWMLQYRKGKHSPRAALRLAIDMAEDPEFPLSREEALERVEAVLKDPPMLPVEQVDASDDHLLARGLPASPGQAIGTLTTSVDAAVAAEGRGEPVILARRETSPSDIAGMAASVGILTTLGGLVSHAAVVARGWGLPAVVGAKGVEILIDGIRAGDRFIPNGTLVTVDGTDGSLLLGAHVGAEIEAPEVAVLRSWQRDTGASTTPVEVTGYSEPATDAAVARALSIKGMGDAATLASVLGASEGAVADILSGLVEAGKAIAMPRGRFRPTPELAQQIDAYFLETADRIKADLMAAWDPFHDANDAFKALVTDWQMREVNGEQVLNDHSDPAYDASVIGRLRPEVHVTIVPIIEAIAKPEPRLIRYRNRLDEALNALEAGDSEMFAHPLKNSYHTVWFELHEELIRLSGRTRTE